MNSEIDVRKVFVKQKVTIESLDDRFNLFDLPIEEYKKLLDFIKNDLKIGRAHHKAMEGPKSTSKCLDSCVSRTSTGHESGIFYAIDFGGTNIRCVRTNLLGNGKLMLDSYSRDARSIKLRGLPKGLLDPNATATELFDEIAETAVVLMQKYDDMKLAEENKKLSIGFTFSYGVKQTSLNKVSCTGWTKGWETGNNTLDPVVGEDIDVCLLLQEALDRKKVPATVVAVLNDTVGTLLSGSYTKPPSMPRVMIGAILGTGFNCCYWDPKAHDYSYIGNIINCELGNFSTWLPRNIIDYEVDDCIQPCGAQLLEKMVAGLFIPELCRLAIVRIFRSEVPKKAWCQFALTTKSCLMMADDKSEDYEIVREALEVQLDWDRATLTNLKCSYVSRICKAVCSRSAACAAAAIAACALLTGRFTAASGGLTVAVDGSLYTKNKTYPAEIGEYLEKLLTKDISKQINFLIATDGSGIGACVLAACASR